MSSGVVILIIGIVLVLIAITIGIYFAYFRKTNPSTGATTPTPTPPTLTILNPGGFTGLNPVGNGNGFRTLNPITSSNCENYINGILGSDSLETRGEAASRSNNICISNGQLKFWNFSNGQVYTFITRNSDITPVLLGTHYNDLFSNLYPKGITNNPTALNLSLWAIRALPTNSAQLQEFRDFWDKPIPPILQPQGTKPEDYPDAI